MEYANVLLHFNHNFPKFPDAAKMRFKVPISFFLVQERVNLCCD